MVVLATPWACMISAAASTIRLRVATPREVSRDLAPRLSGGDTA
jgi:hypothetical protein